MTTRPPRTNAWFGFAEFGTAEFGRVYGDPSWVRETAGVVFGDVEVPISLVGLTVEPSIMMLTMDVMFPVDMVYAPVEVPLALEIGVYEMVIVEHARGDTFERSYKVKGFQMETPSLAGLTISITIKTEIDDDREDETAELRHDLVVSEAGEVVVENGIRVGGVDPETGLVVTGVESGVFTHLVTYEESTELQPGDYVYDVQVKTGELPARVKTVIEAAPWKVRGDVTRRYVPVEPIAP